jgi:prepilin-type N-terminal cleavage/methylation domain-containing protein
MKSKKGFTLVELMVVVVIVALLAALLIPMLTARIEAARWSEGKAAAGTIATALRAYVIERAELEPSLTVESIVISDFMNPADLTGKYFQYTSEGSDYALTNVTYTPNNQAPGSYVLTYTITVSPGTGPSATANMWTKPGYTLDETGEWVEVGAGG